MESYINGVLILDRPRMSAITENDDENSPRAPKDYSRLSIESMHYWVQLKYRTGAKEQRFIKERELPKKLRLSISRYSFYHINALVIKRKEQEVGRESKPFLKYFCELVKVFN